MPMLAVAARFTTEMMHLRAVVALTRATFDLARLDTKRLRSKHGIMTAAMVVHGAARTVAHDAVPLEGAFLVACAQYELAVRDLIEATTTAASAKVAAYASLPLPMRSSHVWGAAHVLQRLDRERFKHLNASDVIKSLAGCVGQQAGTPYSLLPEAFSANDKNFKSEVVSSHIGDLGLKKFWQQMGKQANLQTTLGTNTPDLTTRLAKQKLDAFMDRRNGLIHRGKGVPLVGESEVLEAADFYGAVISSTANVLHDFVSTL